MNRLLTIKKPLGYYIHVKYLGDNRVVFCMSKKGDNPEEHTIPVHIIIRDYII